MAECVAESYGQVLLLHRLTSSPSPGPWTTETLALTGDNVSFRFRVLRGESMSTAQLGVLVRYMADEGPTTVSETLLHMYAFLEQEQKRLDTEAGEAIWTCGSRLDVYRSVHVLILQGRRHLTL